MIAYSEAFFARHGDKSIFLARFTPGARAFILLLAGTMRMSARRFYAANVVSALAWAPSNVLPGVIVGESLDLLGAAAKTLGILLVLLVILIWTIVMVVRSALRRGLPSCFFPDQVGLGWKMIDAQDRAAIVRNQPPWAERGLRCGRHDERANPVGAPDIGRIPLRFECIDVDKRRRAVRNDDRFAVVVVPGYDPPHRLHGRFS